MLSVIEKAKAVVADQFLTVEGSDDGEIYMYGSNHYAGFK
jgi:hypothetical protein